MKHIKIVLGICILTVQAFGETEIGFDEIVDNLSRSKNSTKIDRGAGESFEDIQIHVGLGVTNGVFSIQHPDGSNTQVNQRGVAVNLGIDLFSDNVMAESGIMSYLEQQYDRSNVGLQEFNLKLIYKDHLEPQVGYRFGGGLAARYLTVRTKGIGEEKFSTPAWLALAGLDIFLTKGLSLGGEVAGRGSLTNETPDQSSMDFGLRLDAHF